MVMRNAPNPTAIDGVPIGGGTPAAGAFTTINTTGNAGFGVALANVQAAVDALASIRLRSAAAQSNFTDFKGIPVVATAYTTILTVTPSGVAGSFTRGIVTAKVGGSTGGVGNGATIAQWYIDISDGAPTVGTIAAAVASGTGAPLFRLNVSGNAVQFQVQSSDGVGSFGGTAYLEITLPKPEGTARTWSYS